MHLYLKLTRACGLCPCTTAGLNNCWLMYSVTLLTIFVIPWPVIFSIGMLKSGVDDVQLLPLHMNNLSLPVILAVHFWQLCFNNKARPVMTLLVKHRPRCINWLLPLTLATCWILTQRIIHSHLIRFVAQLVFIFPTEMLAPVILLQFCQCVEEITSLLSCLFNYKGDFKTLMEIELGVIQQAKFVADFYAPQLTVACINKFFHGVLNADLLYSALRKETWDLIAWRTALSTLTLIDLSLVIWNIHNLQKMVQKCKARMFCLVMKDEELPTKMYVWSYLVTNDNVRFTACGLFQINNSFVTSLVAASFSFLLMLNSLTTQNIDGRPTVQPGTGENSSLFAFTNQEA